MDIVLFIIEICIYFIRYEQNKFNLGTQKVSLKTRKLALNIGSIQSSVEDL